MMEFHHEKNTKLRQYYGNYLIREWNSKHTEIPIDTLTIYFMEELTSLEDRTPEPNKIMLWSNKSDFQ